MLALHVLASGSKGNAAIVENLQNGEGVLIDCGICKRDFLSRCNEASFDISKLKAILITHEHSDHIGQLDVIMRAIDGLDCSLYLLSEIAHESDCMNKFKYLRSATEFDLDDVLRIGELSVTVFETSHDSIASCGFRFESPDGDVLGFMTDTGFVTEAAKAGLSNARILAIESNHDTDMLNNGQYPYFLKKRIGGDKGHLSNQQASDAICELCHDGLEHVVAMHLSHNNNLPSLVREELGRTIESLESKAQLHIASQIRLVSVT